jgi:hypothetical protein
MRRTRRHPARTQFDYLHIQRLADDLRDALARIADGVVPRRRGPGQGAAEIARVLRSGGHTVVAVPLVWEHDRTILEHRYTSPELASLFGEWEDVTVVENGGRAVAWATLTGSLAGMIQWNLPERPLLRQALRPAFAGFYVLVNGAGLLLDRAERRYARNSATLPMNLLLTARRPDRAPGS